MFVLYEMNAFTVALNLRTELGRTDFKWKRAEEQRFSSENHPAAVVHFQSKRTEIQWAQQARD